MSRDVGSPPEVDFADAMSGRYEQNREQQPRPQQPAAERSTRSSAATTTRRSWLLPRDVADELSAAASQIHHSSGGTISKTTALGALLRGGLDNAERVTAELLNQHSH